MGWADDLLASHGNIRTKQRRIRKHTGRNVNPNSGTPLPAAKVAEVELVADQTLGNNYSVGASTNVSPTTVSEILKRRAILESTLRPYDKTYHDRLLSDRVLGILERADPDTTNARELQSLAIAQGIFTDKLLLVRGQPTEIYGHVHSRAEDVMVLGEKLARILKFMAAKEININTTDYKVHNGNNGEEKQ